MKATVERRAALRALSKIQSTVARRAGMGGDHVVLKATGEGLILSGSSAEMGVEARVAARVIAEGEAASEARKLYELFREMPEGELSVEAAEGAIELQAARVRVRLNAFPSEGMPAVRAAEGIPVRVRPAFLSQAIRSTTFATGGEDRGVLSGVLLELEGPVLRLVATDGHRLSLKEVPLEEEATEACSLVASKRALEAVRSLLDEAVEETASLWVSPEGIWLEAADVRMFARSLEGTFPDYRRVMPQRVVHTAVVERRGLLGALRRASLMAGRGNAVELRLEGDTLEVSAQGEAGRLAEEIELRAGVSSGIQLTFNVRYLLDALQSLDSEEVAFGVIDTESPAVIRPHGHTGGVSLVMPMRV